MTCGQCGAKVRAEASYCEMCGAAIERSRSTAIEARHGLTGTGIIIVIAASSTGLAIIAGVIVLIRSFFV